MKNSYWPLLLAFFLFSRAAEGQTPTPFPALNISLLGRWAVPDSAETYTGLTGYAADGREYAIIGTCTGTAFVEVTRPEQPRLIAHLRGHRPAGVGGRSYQTYQQYAYGITEAQGGQALQIFDLRYLPDSVRLLADDTVSSVGAKRLHLNQSTLWLTGNWRDSAGLRYTDITSFSLAQPASPQLLRTYSLQLRAGGETCHALVNDADTVYAVLGGYGALRYVFAPTGSGQRDAFFVPHLCTDIATDPAGKWLLTLNPEGGEAALSLTLKRHHQLPRGITPKHIVDFGLPGLVQPRRAYLFDRHPYAAVAYQQEGVQVWSLADSARPVRVGFFDTHPAPVGPTVYQGAAGCQAVARLPSGLLLATDYAGGLFVLTPPWPWTPIPRLAPPDWRAGVWPNPSSGEIRVALPYAPASLRIEVLDAFGRSVRSAESWSKPAEAVGLSVAGLAPGTYWLRLHRPDEPPLLHRVVVVAD